MKKQILSQYKKDSIIRLQLGMDGENVRWVYNGSLGEWRDSGDCEDWADALVLATTFEPGKYVAWPKEPVAVIQFDNAQGVTMKWHMPLETHPWFPKHKLNGFPRPSKDNRIPKCGCGADTTWRNNMTHMDYCHKGIMLKALGVTA